MLTAARGNRKIWGARGCDGRKNREYPRLALPAIRKKIREMVKMMQAFRVVLMNGQHKTYNQPHSDQRRAAQDVADLIMHGSIPSVGSEFGIAAGKDGGSRLWQFQETSQKQ